MSYYLHKFSKLFVSQAKKAVSIPASYDISSEGLISALNSIVSL